MIAFKGDYRRLPHIPDALRIARVLSMLSLVKKINKELTET